MNYISIKLIYERTIKKRERDGRKEGGKEGGREGERPKNLQRGKEFAYKGIRISVEMDFLITSLDTKKKR